MKKLSSLLFATAFVCTTACQNEAKKVSAPNSESPNQKVAGLPETFTHQAAGEGYEALLQTVKNSVPATLKGYQAATFINGAKEASGNFERNSTLTVDLDKKTITVNVIDPPKKDGAVRKTGSLTTTVYLEDGKAWVAQSFAQDPVGNWKIPVNVQGDTLQAPASEFQYLDTSAAAVEKRANDLTYNLKKRAQEAGFQETSTTRYAFVFGVDAENKGIYLDREVRAVSTGEKDEAGRDALKNITVRLALTETALPAVEN